MIRNFYCVSHVARSERGVFVQCGNRANFAYSLLCHRKFLIKSKIVEWFLLENCLNCKHLTALLNTVMTLEHSVASYRIQLGKPIKFCWRRNEFSESNFLLRNKQAHTSFRVSFTYHYLIQNKQTTSS